MQDILASQERVWSVELVSVFRVFTPVPYTCSGYKIFQNPLPYLNVLLRSVSLTYKGVCERIILNSLV